MPQNVVRASHRVFASSYTTRLTYFPSLTAAKEDADVYPPADTRTPAFEHAEGVHDACVYIDAVFSHLRPASSRGRPYRPKSAAELMNAGVQVLQTTRPLRAFRYLSQIYVSDARVQPLQFRTTLNGVQYPDLHASARAIDAAFQAAFLQAEIIDTDDEVWKQERRYNRASATAFYPFLNTDTPFSYVSQVLQYLNQPHAEDALTVYDKKSDCPLPLPASGLLTLQYFNYAFCRPAMPTELTSSPLPCFYYSNADYTKEFLTHTKNPRDFFLFNALYQHVLIYADPFLSFYFDVARVAEQLLLTPQQRAALPH